MYYALGICVLAATLLAYALWLEPNWLQAHIVDMVIPGLDPRLEGFSILHLSDLHQRRFGPGQRHLLRAISHWRYDIVAITGDLLSHPAPYDFGPSAELLAGLGAPVFFVYGNHDYPQHHILSKDLLSMGVHILANSRTEIIWQGAIVQVAGVHDPNWSRNNPRSWVQADLDAALAGTDPEKFTLLLSHSPGILEAAAAWEVPLILCGHTHGGQIKIPLLGAPTTASGKLFDRLVQGLYTEGKTRLYINRGLGTTAMPLRFLSRPEAVLVKLIGS